MGVRSITSKVGWFRSSGKKSSGVRSRPSAGADGQVMSLQSGRIHLHGRKVSRVLI